MAEIQAKASINGSKQFQDDLKRMTARSKALDAEMKEMTTRFEKDGKAMGDDAKQRQLSSKQIEAQKEKIALLCKELQRLEKDGNGETQQAYKLREQIAKANTELTNMEHASDKAADGQKSLTAAMLKGHLGATAITAALRGAVSVMKSIVSAAGSAARAVWDLGVDSGQWADELITQGNQFGIDTETLQEWGYAARFIDTEVSTMTSGMKKLTTAYAKGNKAKKKSVTLTKGVTVSLKKENGEIKSQSEFYLDVIDQLHGMTNVAQRNAAAQKIFGKSYTDMLPLIESGTSALRAYGQEAREMGVIISSENVGALGAFDDQMQKLNAQFAAIKTNIAVAFLPILNTVADRMSGFFGVVSKAISDGLQEEDVNTIVDAFFAMFEPAMSDDGRQNMNAIEFVSKLASKLIEQLGVNKQKIIDLGSGVMGFVWDGVKGGLGTLWNNFVDQFVNFSLDESPINKWIDEQVETVVGPLVIKGATAGWQFLESVGQGILDAWESLKTAVSTIWTNLTTWVSEKWTSATTAGYNLLTNIGTGISNAWETVKTTVSTVGTNLFTIIGEWITTAAENGKELISGFVSSMYTKWTEKLTTIGNIGTELVTTFGLWIEAAKNWGKDLIKNFIGGIKQKWQDLKDGIKGIGQGIKNLIGFSEPKEGPLSDFHTYAPDMVDLFVKGINANAYKIDNALMNAFGVLPSTNPTVSGARTTNLGGVSINVYGAAGQDVNQLADIVMARMQNAVSRREAVFA